VKGILEMYYSLHSEERTSVLSRQSLYSEYSCREGGMLDTAENNCVATVRNALVLK
jgi:hypothetical protein